MKKKEEYPQILKHTDKDNVFIFSLSFLPLTYPPTFPDTPLPLNWAFFPLVLMHSTWLTLSPHHPCQSYVPSSSSSPQGSPSSAPPQVPVAPHQAIPPPPAEITTSCQKLSLCGYMSICVYNVHTIMLTGRGKEKAFSRQVLLLT